MKEETMKKKFDSKDLVRNVRIAQALMLGVFVLGISMMTGDYADSVDSPFSTLSITTTLFGFAGTIVCEIFARRAEKW